MAKLEQDNRIIAELDKKVKRVSSSQVAPSSSAFLSSSLPSLTTSQLYRSFNMPGLSGKDFFFPSVIKLIE